MKKEMWHTHFGEPVLTAYAFTVISGLNEVYLALNYSGWNGNVQST